MPYTCTASSHAAPMSRGFVRIVKVVFFCALAAAVLLDLTLHLAHAGAHLPTSWTAEEAVKTPCVLVDGVLDVETGNVMYNTPKPTGDPVRYVAPPRRSSRMQAVGFNPSRDVQTLGTFSCASPWEEPTGMHKGRTVNMDDTIRVTTTTSPAFAMACYSAEVDIVCRNLQREGVWEWDVARALQYAKNYIPPAQRPFPATVVVDVGGNVGFFGLMAASQGHHVYMFEPGEVNRALVRSSMCLNPGVGNNVMLFPYGGGEHQQCRMYSDIGNVGDGHTTCDPAFVLPDRYAERSAIQLAPLEDVLGTELQIFMLKIDVEGYEYDVMKTAKRLLKGKIAFITTEVSRRMMGAEKMEAYFQLLWESGFATYKTFFERQRINTLDDIRVYLNSDREYNIFCVHRTWQQQRQQIDARMLNATAVWGDALASVAERESSGEYYSRL